MFFFFRNISIHDDDQLGYVHEENSLIISHELFLEVDELLRKYNVDGMTFYSVRGRGRSKQEEVSSRNEIVRSVPEFVTGTKIEVIVEDSIAKPIIEDIPGILSNS
jgi:nitrogen regulatory protein P-II 1